MERVSLSAYKEYFILKGGLLIASMVGLSSRATMDMDATIRNHPVSEESVQHMFEEIIRINLDDDITFTFRQIGKIREKDEYDGYRVALTANFLPMQIPLKLDITTGDKKDAHFPSGRIIPGAYLRPIPDQKIMCLRLADTSSPSCPVPFCIHDYLEFPAVTMTVAQAL